MPAKLLYLPKCSFVHQASRQTNHCLLRSTHLSVDIDLVVVVWQVQMSVCAVLGQDNHTNDAAGAAVPSDGLTETHLDEVNCVLLLHVLLPVLLAQTVDVCRSRTSNGVRLLV